MEASSTEKRIDDLNARVTEGFRNADREIKRLDGDIRELRGDVKDLRNQTNERFDSMNARFDAMHRTMMRGFFALGTIMVTLFLAQAGLQGL